MNEFSACPDLEELAAWIDGRVDEPTRLRLVAHLADCDRCAEVVDGVLAFSEELELAEDGAGDSADEDEDDAEAETTPEAPFAPPERVTPRSSRARWMPYLATALVACAVVVGIRWSQDEPFDASELRDLVGAALAGLPPDSRGDGLDEAHIVAAKHCIAFLAAVDAGPAADSDPEMTKDCLELTAKDEVLATQVASAPQFPKWLSDAASRTPACRVLLNAKKLSQTDQDRLGYVACQELISNP